MSIQIQKFNKFEITYGLVVINSEKSREELIEELEELKAAYLKENAERNLIEDTLRESEVRISAITDSAHDAIIMMDHEGLITFWNPAAEKLLGYTNSEATKKNLHELIAPQRFHKSHLEAFPEFLRTGKGEAIGKTIAGSALAKNGQVIDVELSLSSVKINENWHSVGIIRDVTVRKQSEYYQQISTEILEILNEPIPFSDAINRILSIFKEGMNFDAVGLRLVAGDDFPYLKQIGFSNDFLLTENTLVVRDRLGQPCLDKNGNPSLECTCGLVISGASDLENPLFTKSGSFWTNYSIPLLDMPLNEDPRLHPRNNCIHKGYMSVALVPIKVQNKIVGLLQLNDKKEDRFTLEMIHFLEGICANIGAALWRKQIDDNLRKSEDRYRKAQEVGHVGSWEFDIKNRTLWGSDETKRIFGFENLNDPFDKETIENCVIEKKKVDNALIDLIVKRKPYNIEYEILPLNSSEKRIIHSVAEIVNYETDNNIRITGVIQDITVMKLREAEIIKANEDLRDSNVIIETNLYQKNALIEELSETKENLEKINAEKDKFFSIIAHDLKSPFSGFLGLTKIMVDDFQDLTMKDMKSFSHSMMASANNLYKLLENLLEWSRMQRGVTEFNPEICDLSKLIKQNVDIQSELAKQKDIELINNIPENANIMADEAMLNTVIRNLMSNAIKFTNRGGKIELGVLPDGKNTFEVLVYIKDNGLGMDSVTIMKLFQIDKKVSRPGTEGEPSSGLGLLLCKEFIEKQGGRIWVESQVGKGSTFYFTLPKPKTDEIHES